jgi:hypothetical protein
MFLETGLILHDKEKPKRNRGPQQWPSPLGWDSYGSPTAVELVDGMYVLARGI